MRNPTPFRLLRRAGIWLLMWTVFVGMGLEWLHHALTELTLPVLRWLRLHRVVPWLQEHSIWWLVPIVFVLAIPAGEAKYIEVQLFLNGHWFAGLVFGLVLKGLGVGIGNVFVGAYAERLLQFAWIARLYGSYAHLRDELRSWMHGQEWYKRAVHLRDRYREWKHNTITMLDFGKRAATMHRCCFSFFTFAR